MWRFRSLPSLPSSRVKMTRAEIYNASYDILILAKESGSCKELAATLGVSVDTLKTRLKALDSLYPISLFENLDSKTVTLSAVGLLVANTAEKIRKMEAELEIKVDKLSAERSGSITIGSLSKGIAKEARANCPFKIRNIFFDVTSKTAEGELRKLGSSNLDIAVGMYDEALLKKFHLASLEIENATLAVAMATSLPLSRKKQLDIEDLYEKKLYLPRRGFSRRLDTLSNDLKDFHARISVLETDGYSEELLKEITEDEEALLLTPPVDLSSYGLRCVRVDWSYRMSFGYLFSQKPSEKVATFINAVKNLDAMNDK